LLIFSPSAQTHISADDLIPRVCIRFSSQLGCLYLQWLLLFLKTRAICPGRSINLEWPLIQVIINQETVIQQNLCSLHRWDCGAISQQEL